MKATTLAERIRTRRIELGLSVDDLADAAGVSSVAVRKWESGGTSNLKHEHLFTVAEMLNVQPRWLALGDGQKEAYSGRDAYSVALSRRDLAPTEKAKRAWERISLVFAKAAMIAMLALGTLLQPSPAQAGGSSALKTASCVLCKMLRRLFRGLRPACEMRTAG